MDNFFDNISFLEAKETAKRNSSTGTGVLTIINASAKGNGTRILFSKQLEEDLEFTDNVQIATDKDGTCLYVGAELNSSQTSYKLHRLKKGDSNSRLVLYNSAVIKEISEKLNLSFEERVGVTFYGIEYLDMNGRKVAKVWKGEE